MGHIYLLLLVIGNPDATFNVDVVDSFDYLPSCRIAAEGRQMYLTAEGNYADRYTCVQQNYETGD